MGLGDFLRSYGMPTSVDAPTRIRYGLTECTMASHLPDLKNNVPFGSVGKISPNLCLKIIDPSTEKEVPPGMSGEICIKGPTVMLGYLGRPDATNSTIKNGWLHTGKKELVSNDIRSEVAPAELEDLLLSHPLIRDAAVIGIPDERAGELPRAFIVRASDSLTEEDVKNWVKEKVSPYKQLAGGVEFLREIPKSAAGKILRRVLRERVTSKL
ncbi:CoA ligase domain protein [Necator americanus]|uniref:CoA ligase domain protein n=1 Tax=Necator americanus TaxID=51031 RepID=W2TQ22_NECAM|nr:CoA ligase domain protein [Necator americanus]ETN83226.1 CoA ligase domain protein [Necator americanus]